MNWKWIGWMLKTKFRRRILLCCLKVKIKHWLGDRVDWLFDFLDAIRLLLAAAIARIRDFLLRKIFKP